MQQRYPVHPQSLQRLLEGSADAVAGEVTGARVGIDLRGEHDLRREPAGLTDRGADAAFRGAVLAVAVGGVDEIDRAVEGGENGGDGPFLVDGVPVEPRHAGQRAGPEADRRHGEPRLAQLTGSHGRTAQRPTPTGCGA